MANTVKARQEKRVLLNRKGPPANPGERKIPVKFKDTWPTAILSDHEAANPAGYSYSGSCDALKFTTGSHGQ
jgi:hypothetical protein